MTLLSQVKSFFTRAQTIAPVAPRDPALASLFGFGSLSASGATVTAETAMRVAAVYACVRVRAQAVAGAPLHLYRKTPTGGWEKATDHPLYGVLHLQPNDWQTSFEWRETSVAHYALRGDAYSRIVIDGAGRIERLLPLHPDRVWPFLADNGRIAYRYLNPKGGTEYLIDSEVFRIPGLTFDPTARSLSPIEVHRNTIGNAMVASEYQGSLWANSAVPKGGLKTPAALGDEAIKSLRKNWNDRHAGPGNAGQIAIFHGGLDWVDIGMTNEDAQYVELMQMSVSDIARIFGVQPHKIGDLSKATFSNIEQQAIEFVTDVVRPECERWEDRMTLSLLTPAERLTYKIGFDLNGLLRGDSAARAALYRVLFTIGALAPNDARRLEGFDPLQGDAAEESYVQINTAPLNSLLDVLMKAPARPQPNGNQDDGTQNLNA